MSLTGKILIVDDEERIRFFLSEILTSDGQDVTTAENGEQALATIAEQEFDLAMLDLNLPDMNGMEILAKLKEQWPETVVIILTAHASLETSIEALRQGTHDYLFKPCRASELRESIGHGLEKRKRVLEQRKVVGQLNQLTNVLQDIQGGSADQPGVNSEIEMSESVAVETTSKTSTEDNENLLQYDGLVVDKLRHVITYYDEPLNLSSTEYRLLVYLISHAPRVIPPEELMENVLGYDADLTEAGDLIRQHIHRIRRKIKSKSDGTPVIKTVRSVGYAVGK